MTARRPTKSAAGQRPASAEPRQGARAATSPQQLEPPAKSSAAGAASREPVRTAAWSCATSDARFDRSLIQVARRRDLNKPSPLAGPVRSWLDPLASRTRPRHRARPEAANRERPEDVVRESNCVPAIVACAAQSPDTFLETSIHSRYWHEDRHA